MLEDYCERYKICVDFYILVIYLWFYIKVLIKNLCRMGVEIVFVSVCWVVVVNV